MCEFNQAQVWMCVFVFISLLSQQWQEGSWEDTIWPPTCLKAKTYSNNRTSTRVGGIKGNNFLPNGALRVIDQEHPLSLSYII